MKVVLKKSLSLFLSMIMVLSIFGVAGVGVIAADESVITTSAEETRGSISISGYSVDPASTFTLTYPTDIYLSVDENLSDTGAYFQATGNFGTETTPYRIYISSFNWGGQTYDISSTFFNPGTAGWHPDTYAPTENKTLVNNFGNFGVTSNETYHTTSTGTAGTGCWYDFNNYGNHLVYGCGQTSNFDLKMYLTGTPNSAGDFTYTYNGSTTSDENKMNFAAGRYSGTTANYDDWRNWQYDQVPINQTISYTIHVYDKSGLEASLSPSGLQASSAYTPVSWNRFETARTDARAVLAQRNITQSEIDAATTAVNAAYTALVPVAETVRDSIRLDDFANHGDNWIEISYPTDLYVPLGGNLDDTNEYILASGHYGDSANHRMNIGSNVWGGQSYDLPTNWGFAASDWLGNVGYTPPDTTLIDNFNNYGIKPQENYHNGNTGTAGTGSWYEANNYSESFSDTTRQLIYSCENPNNFQMYMYLTGSPKTTGDFSYSYNGAEQNNRFTFLYASRSRSSAAWGFTRVTINDTISFTIHVYDKTALNAAINATPTYGESYYTAESWSTYQAALTFARQVAATEKLTQNDVDTTTAALTAAFNGLELRDADYTAVDAAMLTLPLPDRCYSTATIEAYRNAISAVVRGLKINEQTRVNAMATAITTAYNALVVEHQYNTAVTDPTCTVDGYTTYTCPNCGDTKTDDITPATGHTYGDWYTRNNGTHARDCVHGDHTETADCTYTDVITDPTCTAGGYTTHTCTVCSFSYQDNETLATGHKYGDWVSNNNGSHYKNCNEGDDTVTEPCSYETNVVAPTCTEQGYTTHTCTVCGYSYDDTYTEAIGHHYGDWYYNNNNTHAKDCNDCDDVVTEACSYEPTGVVAPTCTEQGYTTYTCSVCGHSYDDDYTPVIEHSWNEGVVTTEPTCTEDGVKTFTCTACNTTRTETVDALGHDYIEDVVAPTCTEQGYTTHTCSRGDHTYTDTYTDALTHDWHRSEITTEPTCTETGVRTFYCSRCDATETEEVDALGHDYIEDVVAPTCTEQGYTTHTCSRGDHTYTDTYTDALTHDWHRSEITTEPTCTEKGEKTFYCSRCDATETEEVDALGHDWNDGIVTTEPTCTEDGVKTTSCSRCNEETTQVVTALGHDWDEGTVTTDPTCTEKGEKTFNCSRCEDKRYEDIDATGHTYTSVVTAPTCTEQGYTTHTCIHGDDTYTDSYTDALTHDLHRSEITTPPTCTEKGVRTFYCSRCDFTETEEVDALGHDWDEGSVTTEPTCTEKGVKTFNCSRCEDKIYEDVDATGHTYTPVVTAPTCTEQGYTTHTCIHGDDTYTDSYTDALTHDLHRSEITTPPTCTEKGVRTFYCSRCDFTETEEVAALGHDYIEDVVAPTCTEQGYTTHTCSRCDDTRTDSEVDALGHKYREEKIEATCTSGGYTLYTCNVCNHYYRDDIVAALGHDYVAVKTEPTCTEDGYTTYTCSRCDDYYITDTVTALGHTPTVTKEAKEPTCTEDGYTQETTCSVCLEILSQSQTITALGHHCTPVVTAPTCTEGGYTTYSCTRCDYFYIDGKTEAFGHSWDEGTVETEADCTNKGVKVFECTVCHEKRNEDIDALGHDYVTTSVTAPTCTEDGFTTYTCTRCDHSYDGDKFPAYGHNYVDTVTAPTCTEGGYTTHTCSRCDDTYTDTYVDALGHKHVETVTAPTCTEDGYSTFVCSVCGDTYTANETTAIGHNFVEVERVEATATMSGYSLHRCENCGDEYRDILYFNQKALVCITIYDDEGNPVTEATITVTNIGTGESFIITTDLNGYFTHVLPEGDYKLSIHKDGLKNADGYISVTNGQATIQMPTMERHPCDCICHQDNVWARLYKVLCKFLSLFGYKVSCCNDSELY